ncbi:MAG: outer membrane lipoprotein-sorting protein [Candidatus Acetothermia bacterium]
MINGDRGVSITLIAVILGLLIAMGVGAIGAEEISGDEVLENMDRQSEIVTQGDITSVLTFNNENADGTTNSRKFGALAHKKEGESNYQLVYFLEPQFIRGSIFLSKENEDGTTRMWLFLPALPQPKELSASKQEGSFAGSALSYEEIGSWTMSTEFNAEIVEETTVEVGDETFPVYKLDLTPKEGVEVDNPDRTVWIAKESWLLMKSEQYGPEGELQKTMEVKSVTTFEGKTVTKELTTADVESGKSTTVIYETRERPPKEVPMSTFAPEHLSEFDPVKWGLAKE